MKASPRNSWFKTQADAGLPLTFDEWRTNYDRLTYPEQLAYYNAVYEKFPMQKVGNVQEAIRFCSQLEAGSTVLEVGGGRGDVARQALQETAVSGWFNYEISGTVVNHGLRHPCYTAIVPHDFVWNLRDLPPCDALIASHVFEHVRASQIDRLLGRLASFSQAYVECPIPADADAVDWSGSWSTHILEIGWKQLEQLFANRGFQVAHCAPDIRWFQRSRTESSSKA